MFDERALFYAASCYAQQKLSNEQTWYFGLKPVIALQVLDYDSNRVRGITRIPNSIEDVDKLFVERIKKSSAGIWRPTRSLETTMDI